MRQAYFLTMNRMEFSWDDDSHVLSSDSLNDRLSEYFSTNEYSEWVSERVSGWVKNWVGLWVSKNVRDSTYEWENDWCFRSNRAEQLNIDIGKFRPCFTKQYNYCSKFWIKIENICIIQEHSKHFHSAIQPRSSWLKSMTRSNQELTTRSVRRRRG